MNFWHTILSAVFPEKCLGCGKAGTALCPECVAAWPGAERESAKWIFPVYDYRHPLVKKALWLFKYKGKRGLAPTFAEIIYEMMLEEISELGVMENFREPMLVPIPLSPKRLRERGYNQAELMCVELIKINALRRDTNISFAKNILTKTKDTEHQAHIRDRRQRIENMRDTFSVPNPNLVAGQNIILVDDILTTGATLSEARRVLRDAGARKIIAFTVAH
ncbi:MAG: ComF family protein [bacterium]|nr:ComF family protein [bacterium]